MQTPTPIPVPVPAPVSGANFSSTSLYVGDLHPDVSEATLFEVFNAVGPVASIRVCRDAVTRRSLTYAYVNFHNPVDAERALDTMNYTPIKGQPMRIMWSQRDPSVRKSGVGNIFIKNLDKTIDNKALYDTFSAFGNILSCKVVCDENGSKGYGFVHYETSESAELSIQKVNGMLLNGVQVFVGHFVAQRERSEGRVDPDQIFTNIFVKNLPDDVTSERLRSIFEHIGEITSAVTMEESDGKGRGFGFVCFEKHEDAAAAVEEFDGKEYEGKTLYVGRAQKKSEREADLRQKYEQMKVERANRFQGVNLYIKNLDDSVDDERIRQEFSVYGTITSAKIMKDEKGNSKGFGFVCFSSPEEATKAVTEMNGRIFVSKPLYVALAQRREDRKQQLAAQYNQRVVGARMQQASAGMPQGMPQFPSGAPMFYQGPPVLSGAQQRPVNGPMYPPMQAGAVRPRWAPAAGQSMRPGFQPVPGLVGPPGAMGGRQPPRANRPSRNAQPSPTGGVASSVAAAVSGPAGGANNLRTINGPQQISPQSFPAQTPLQNQQQPAPHPQKGQRGFKYNSNVRNSLPSHSSGKPSDSANSGERVLANGVASVTGQDPLTASALAQASVEAQKTILGEKLFPLIQELQPDLAGKITGMLLEMDNTELLHLLESPEALSSKVNEALGVLKAHQAQLHGDVNSTVEVDA
eukprot:Sdes_comp10621_c0_seq1m2314